MRQAVAEARGETADPEIETTVDAPIDAFVPKSFLPSELHRLAMYRRIAEIGDGDSFTDLLDEFNDRYGDLPDPVLNLMQLSLIRAYARAAGFSEVRVRETGVTLTYDGSAKPDGMRLLAILSEEPDAKLIAGDQTKIVWVRKRANVTEYVKILPQFLYRLKHCISPGNAL